MAQIYFPLTSSEDTNDTMEYYNVDEVGMSIADFIAQDTVNRRIENGGVENYPDLVIDNGEVSDSIVCAISGTVNAQLTGGIHAPNRPK